MENATLKNILSVVLAVFVSVNLFAQSPKVLSEVSVVYELTVGEGNADVNASKTLAGAVKNLYVKGSKFRNDLITPAFKQVVIYDSKTDSAVILRELGNSKYISYLDSRKRAEQYKRYEGISFLNTDETKTILGYDCKKVIAKLRDGSQYTIFYAPSIIPSNKAYEFQFQDLPGFALEYEALSEDGKTKVKYAATKITLTPVPAALFDIPKSGYRVL